VTERSMLDAEFERVAELEELAEGQPVGVALADGAPICLVRANDEVFALADRCSHADYPMSDGEVVDEYVIECVLHGAQFDIRTGEVVESPATEGLELYEVKLDEGAVWVRRARA
jgi:3-phenylpropionate/trans-cinnamate dioxygenase ferredoxin subunit